MIGRHSSDDAQAFDDALTSGSSTDQEIAALVQLAESLCEAAVAEPSAQFRADLRAQLMTEAGTVLVRTPRTSPATATQPRTRHPIRRRVVSVAAVLIASTGVVGLVSTSASALPGELLYPVKRTVESVELTLHRSDSSRGSFQLQQATERLEEARQLNAKDASASLIAEALDSFAGSAADGSARLFNDFTESGKEQSVRKVNGFIEVSTAELSELSTQLPPGVVESYRAAAEAVGAAADEALSLCSSCVSGDVQSLVSSVSDLAKKDPPARGEESSEGADATRTTDGQSGKPDDAAKPAPAPTQAGPSDAAPKPAPTSAAPPAPAPTRTPSLRDVTDPLIGGLLGDEDQEGLVPGLLNGLLGGGK